MVYAWSVDEEVYHGEEDSREGAIQAALADEWEDYIEFAEEEHKHAMTIWTGKVVNIELVDLLPDFDFFLEDHLRDALYEECGEWSENFDPTEEQKAKFMKGVEQAMRDSGMEAGCWRVENTKKHVVNEDGNEVKDG